MLRRALAGLEDGRSARPPPRAALAGRTAAEELAPMSLYIEEVRDRLRLHIVALDDWHAELLDLRDEIPPSPWETSDAELHGPLDVATEIRAVIEIQVKDRLEPMIRALQDAADYEPRAPRPEPLDLTQSEARMGEVVRALVIQDWFTEREDEAAPGGVWRPAGTPGQAKLKVCKAGDVWLAVWRKIDAPLDAPEEERWERRFIREDRERPGTLSYHGF
jgi:hypothetical protein